MEHVCLVPSDRHGGDPSGLCRDVRDASGGGGGKRMQRRLQEAASRHPQPTGLDTTLGHCENLRLGASLSRLRFLATLNPPA